MENTFLSKILQGAFPIGTLSALCSPAVIQCMALSGLDFVVLDLEHSPASPAQGAELLAAARGRGLPALVRVPEITREQVLKALDSGAAGVIAPGVKTVEDVKKLIDLGKYPPLGNRGCAFGAGSGWGAEGWITSFDGYFSTCNDRQLLIPQCETVECLEDLDAIAALPGVAGIFVGPFDLSVSMGIPGDFQAPPFRAALEKILSTAHRNGKFAMSYATTPQAAREAARQGMDALVYSSDVNTFLGACRGIPEAVRSGDQPT